MKLQDRVAVVTGAASGMGKAIAKLYAQEGAKVVVADLNVGGLKPLSMKSRVRVGLLQR